MGHLAESLIDQYLGEAAPTRKEYGLLSRKNREALVKKSEATLVKAVENALSKSKYTTKSKVKLDPWGKGEIKLHHAKGSKEDSFRDKQLERDIRKEYLSLSKSSKLIAFKDVTAWVHT